MNKLNVSRKWLDFIESLNLDDETTNYYIDQNNKIYDIYLKSDLDVFLRNLGGVHNTKVELEKLTIDLEKLKNDYSNKKDTLKSGYNDIINTYGFSFKPKSQSLQINSITEKEKYSNSKINTEDSVLSKKLKLKNSNVLVSSKFYNEDSIEINLELRGSNNWVNTSKDSICKSIMPILNEMLIFSEEEFLAVKKRTKFKYFLHPTTFKDKFGSWDLFCDYIDAEPITDVKKVKLSNKNILITEIFNNSLTVSELLKLHKDHGIRWKKESKSFICFASLPILKELTNVTYDEFSVALYKYPYSSLMSMKDILEVFVNWDRFIDYLGVEFITPTVEENIQNLEIEEYLDTDDSCSEYHMASIVDELNNEYGGYDDVGSDYIDFEIEDSKIDAVTEILNSNTIIDISSQNKNVNSINEEKPFPLQKEGLDLQFNSLLIGSLNNNDELDLKMERLSTSGFYIKSYLYHNQTVNDIINLFKTHNLTFTSNLMSKDLICYVAMPILDRMEDLQSTTYRSLVDRLKLKDYITLADIKESFGTWSLFLDYLGLPPKKDIFLVDRTIKRDSKIKLKNSDYYVFADYKNNLTTSQMIDFMVTHKLNWIDLSKNDLAYVSMLILEDLNDLTSRAYTKKQKQIKGYLYVGCLSDEFGGWTGLLDYIGLEYREPSDSLNSNNKKTKEVQVSNHNSNKPDTCVKQINQNTKFVPNSFFNSFKIGLDHLDDYNDEISYIENLDTLQELFNSNSDDFEDSEYTLYPSLAKVYEDFGTSTFKDSLNKFYLHIHKNFKNLNHDLRMKQLLSEYNKLGSPRTEFEFTKHFFSKGNSKTFIPLVIIIDMFGSYPDYLKLLRNWESEQNNR